MQDGKLNGGPWTFPLAASTQAETPVSPKVGGFPILLSAHTLGCFQCALHYAQNKLPFPATSAYPCHLCGLPVDGLLLWGGLGWKEAWLKQSCNSSWEHTAKGFATGQSSLQQSLEIKVRRSHPLWYFSRTRMNLLPNHIQIEFQESMADYYYSFSLLSWPEERLVTPKAEGGISPLLSLFAYWLTGTIFTPTDPRVASNQILHRFFHPEVLRALYELACLGTDSPSKALTYVMRFRKT